MAKIRILEVVGGGMTRAGTETRLLSILRQINRERFHMDFLVHTNEKCAYDDEIRSLGSTIIRAGSTHSPLYAVSLRRILRRYGPYDILHSHTHHFDGFIMRIAGLEAVPVRVTESHCDCADDSTAGWWRRIYLTLIVRRIYLTLTERWIQKYATAGLAISRQAAASLFGPNWASDRRWRIMYYGIDLAPFEVKDIEPQAVRRELGIPPDSLVVGHVGRFVPQKNHIFCLKVAAEVAKKKPNVRFLFVGDGPLRQSIQEQARQMQLGERCLFLGQRQDVPRLMMGAMDVFLFPSRHEGLGLVLVEAQSAGLPCVISDVIPEEADLIREQINRLSLKEPPGVWAEAVLAAAANSFERHKSLAMVKQSKLYIKSSITELEAFYNDCLKVS